jgi:hypothetical protein
MVICRWPQNSEARWGGTGGAGDWQYQPMDQNLNARDSCVVLYWAQVNMKPDEKRDLAFTYGLGRVLADNDPNLDIVPTATQKLRLFTAPGAVAGKPFVVVAYVKDAANQKVTLKLPAGLVLADGEKAEQATEAPNREGYSQLTWRAAAAKPGAYVIEAAGSGGTAKEIVQVRETSLFE